MPKKKKQKNASGMEREAMTRKSMGMAGLSPGKKKKKPKKV